MLYILEWLVTARYQVNRSLEFESLLTCRIPRWSLVSCVLDPTLVEQYHDEKNWARSMKWYLKGTVFGISIGDTIASLPLQWITWFCTILPCIKRYRRIVELVGYIDTPDFKPMRINSDSFPLYFGSGETNSISIPGLVWWWRDWRTSSSELQIMIFQLNFKNLYTWRSRSWFMPVPTDDHGFGYIGYNPAYHDWPKMGCILPDISKSDRKT